MSVPIKLNLLGGKRKKKRKLYRHEEEAERKLNVHYYMKDNLKGNILYKSLEAVERSPH